MLLLVQVATQDIDPPPLPHPVTNNAVAALEDEHGIALYSMLGLDSAKQWDGVGTWAFRWYIGTDRWERLPDVPGPGRLAGTAQSVRGRLFLFGGYSVAEDGAEKSEPQVDVFDPVSDRWGSAAPMPVPVDDAVSGVWRDSLVYLISGWHDTGNITLVQAYDAVRNEWFAATPIPGPPVFGHAGAIAGNTIVYLGGVRANDGQPRFVIEPSAWQGEIDALDPARIEWNQLAAYPGPALYRAASAADEHVIVFAGGTDNPYNYSGIGYNGEPSEPQAGVFGFDTRAGRWQVFEPLSTPTMDHRNIAITRGLWFIVGGMQRGQRVTRRVAAIAPSPR